MAQVSVFSLGGIGSPCCCGTCNVPFTVYRCGTALASATVTVSITGGGSTIATGTTTSFGTVGLSIGSAGTYTVTISKTGMTTVSQDLALACGVNTNIFIGPSAPNSLPLTDVNTSITLSFLGGSPPQWGGGYFVSHANTAVVNTGTPCFASSPGTGDMGICYNVTCNSDGTVYVQRFWTVAGFAGTNYYSRKGASQTNPCVPLGCLGQESNDLSLPSSFSPFAWSGSLTPQPANLLADPVGGTVTLG